MTVTSTQDSIMQTLQQAIAHAEADYCDIRYEDRRRLQISFTGSSLNDINDSQPSGGFVRALSDGAWGSASFSSLKQLESSLASACQQAKAAGQLLRGESQLAQAPIVQDDVQLTWHIHPNSLSLKGKIELLQGYQNLALGFKDIVAVTITYLEDCGQQWYVNSEGTAIRQDRMDLSCSIAPQGRRGDTNVSLSFRVGSANGLEPLFGLDQRIVERCRLIDRLLDAPQVRSGSYTVVCDPIVAGIFWHESFGHLSEADQFDYFPHLKQEMKLGRSFGRSILNVYDSGEYLQRRGGLVYDDEGVSCRRTYLLREGKLVGRLHNRESAAHLGEAATGNARAVNHRFPPIIRMRNTCLEAGESSFEEMISDIEDGLYLCGSGGGQSLGENFSFTFRYAYAIRNGKLEEILRGGQFTGNVFSTIANIDMVGSDFSPGNGSCGKMMQSDLPVGMSSPHMRIQNVVIGGAK